MTVTRLQFDEMVRRLNANRVRQPDEGTSDRPAGVESAHRGRRAESESDLHEAMMEFCRSKGWLFFHGSMAHRTRRRIGEPDFIIVGDGGRVWFVEVKRPGQKLTTEQAATLAWLVKLGAKAAVVTSLDEFREVVK